VPGQKTGLVPRSRGHWGIFFPPPSAGGMKGQKGDTPTFHGGPDPFGKPKTKRGNPLRGCKKAVAILWWGIGKVQGIKKTGPLGHPPNSLGPRLRAGLALYLVCMGGSFSGPAFLLLPLSGATFGRLSWLRARRVRGCYVLLWGSMAFVWPFGRGTFSFWPRQLCPLEEQSPVFALGALTGIIYRSGSRVVSCWAWGDSPKGGLIGHLRWGAELWFRFPPGGDWPGARNLAPGGLYTPCWEGGVSGFSLWAVHWQLRFCFLGRGGIPVRGGETAGKGRRGRPPSGPRFGKN